MTAKQFPIHFLFQHQPVTAFVSVRPMGYDLSFRIRYRDEFIREYLPGGTAVVSLTNGIEKPQQLGATVEALLIATTEAIAEHILEAA